MATTERVRPSSARDIAGRRFPLTRRGYETDEVDEFLHTIAAVFTELESQVRWQQSRIETLERRGASAQDAAYVRLSREFADAIRAADDASRRTLADAETQARVIVDEARAEAGKITSRARDEAERTLKQAREEAARRGWHATFERAPLSEQDFDLGLDLDLAFGETNGSGRETRSVR